MSQRHRWNREFSCLRLPGYGGHEIHIASEGLSAFLSLATEHPDLVSVREEPSFPAKVPLSSHSLTHHKCPSWGSALSLAACPLPILPGLWLRAALRAGTGLGRGIGAPADHVSGPA